MSKPSILFSLILCLIGHSISAQSDHSSGEVILPRASADLNVDAITYEFQLLEFSEDQKKEALEIELSQKHGILSWSSDLDAQRITITVLSTIRRKTVVELLRSKGLIPIESEEESIYLKNLEE